MAKQWLVLHMDEGLLRREHTRKAAVQWCCMHVDGQVIGRHQYGPGAYSYLFGLPGESSNYLSVEREDAARAEGWRCIDDEAKFPYPDDPFQQRDSTENKDDSEYRAAEREEEKEEGTE